MVRSENNAARNVTAVAVNLLLIVAVGAGMAMSLGSTFA